MAIAPQRILSGPRENSSRAPQPSMVVLSVEVASRMKDWVVSVAGSQFGNAEQPTLIGTTVTLGTAETCRIPHPSKIVGRRIFQAMIVAIDEVM